MDRIQLSQLAKQLARGELTVDEFLAETSAAASAELPGVTLDLDRQRRCGYPEVVFGEGKSAQTLLSIFGEFASRDMPALATRLDADKQARLTKAFPTGRANQAARTFCLDGDRSSFREVVGRAAVVSAGSSDMPVAEEARETLAWMGIECELIHDVGVAGPHRLLSRVDELRRADVIVVVAGMEGALPSVVAGHVDCPVFAVPTSVGYGANFGGVAALLGMLNSCAANVAVVNIDAGFKAGYLAGLTITRRRYD
ncbi:MAG: nickel pincer cofactor biosynthesis protein LarB [Pirellulaceae bacterium]|nr:nickel pincer cofactor biosynthesis protein LarB [Pirellulaceae bacterium]MDP7015587.1 nickel pincer cofactor biosynthesis protein LarB [Pirellulaceae bacterium]